MSDLKRVAQQALSDRYATRERPQPVDQGRNGYYFANGITRPYTQEEKPSEGILPR